MNEDKKTPKNEDNASQKRPRSFYIRLISIYAIAILLIILAINYDSFESALNRLFSVITPIFFGALIAYLCNPLFVFFHKKVFKKLKSVKWKKTLSILLTYIVVFLIIFSLLFLVAEQIISSIDRFISNIDTYIANAEDFIVGLIDKLGFIKSESSGGSQTAPPTTSAPTGEATTPDASDRVSLIDFSFTREGVIEAIHNFLSSSGNIINDIGNVVISSGTATIIFVFNLFLGFIFSVYMLAEKDLIIAQAKKFCYAYMRKERADAVCEMANYADEKVGHFIKGKLIESAIVGAMAYLAFLIFNIPGPLMIAVLVAIMNIIPIFGPFLGAVPAALLVLIMDPAKTIPYIIIVVIIMQINGNYISPRIVGNRTGLTPLGAIAALTLMSGYFGIIGMFIGIPICAIIIEYCWIQANKRLEKKELETDLAAYYPPDALIEKENGDGKPHNFTAIVVNAVVSVFCKLFRINRNKKNDKNNTDGTSDE